MDVGFERLQTFFLRHAEMLLLVDYQQAEIGEFHRLAEQCMGADRDIDRSAGDALAHVCRVFRRDQPRELRDAHGQALEAVAEGGEMLAAQQRGGDDDRGLLARERGDERGAQRDFGLAVAHVAADEAVHRLALAQVVEAFGDGALLVFGLGPRKLRGEFVVKGGAYGERRRGAQGALGGGPDQRLGHVAQAVLHARLARLPRGPAEAVEGDVRRPAAAVARQHLDVLHRQVELVVAGVEQDEAVVRGVPGLDGFQPRVTADAVIDMHGEVAVGKFSGRGDEIGGAAAARGGPRQAVAQDVLLGQQRNPGAGEAVLQAEHDRRDRAARQRLGLRPCVDRLDGRRAVLAQQARKPVARARAVAGQRGAPSGLRLGAQVRAHGVVGRAVAGLAFGREIARAAGAGVECAGAAGRLERAERAHRTLRQRRFPGLRVEEQRFRRNGLVGRRVHRPGFHALQPRQVVVRRLVAALGGRCFGFPVEQNRRAGQIFEKRFKAFVEQRQPVLHAGMAAPGGNGFVERVVGRCGAEQRPVPGAEARDRAGVEAHFRRRRQLEPAARPGGALRERVECAQTLYLVAEQVDAHGRRRAGGIQIDNAAAERVFAGLEHRAHAPVAAGGEMLGERVGVERAAGADGDARAGERGARRQFLRRRVDCRGEEHAFAFAPRRERAEAALAVGGDVGARGNAIVGQAIPRRQDERAQRRREQRERGDGQAHARVVAGDEDDVLPGRGGAQLGDRQRVAAVRRAGDCRASGRGKAFGQRCHAFRLRSGGRRSIARMSVSWAGGGGAPRTAQSQISGSSHSRRRSRRASCAAPRRSRCESAKRPRSRSASREPRRQQRKRKRFRRASMSVSPATGANIRESSVRWVAISVWPPPPKAGPGTAGFQPTRFRAARRWRGVVSGAPLMAAFGAAAATCGRDARAPRRSAPSARGAA